MEGRELVKVQFGLVCVCRAPRDGPFGDGRTTSRRFQRSKRRGEDVPATASVSEAFLHGRNIQAGWTAMAVRVTTRQYKRPLAFTHSLGAGFTMDRGLLHSTTMQPAGRLTQLPLFTGFYRPEPISKTALGNCHDFG
jgi:hypothetical protein